MNFRTRRVVRAVVFLTALSVLCLGSYSLAWGKLFPFSPLILGFEKRELPHVTLYFQDGGPQVDYDWVDGLIPEVEAFHELSFSRKPRVFFFSDRATYAARSLSRARFCAFFNGDIVVSPWAREEDTAGTISMRIYLTHELSHSVLYQNMALLNLPRYPRWLLEGVATYSADQMGATFYPSKAETLAAVRAGNWLPPELYETDAEDGVPLTVPYRKTFMYSEFACIVDALIAEHGRAAFMAYLHELLTDGDHEAVFTRHFGMSFADALSAFRRKAQGE